MFGTQWEDLDPVQRIEDVLPDLAACCSWSTDRPGDQEARIAAAWLDAGQPG
jgi:hypothetical protein